MYHVLIQYMLKAGLKWYKERITKGVESELKTIKNKLTLSPVPNKWVNGSQIMVAWNVNDLKIPHKGAGEVKKIIMYLDYIHGPMTVKQVKNNIYLGMEIYFT